ncbi:MAG TPA: hypothetical protein VGS78_06385 [Candidatus Sulfotelmatobacter sp.]|nr:hypothetical protein [Candidatus Sulfotelmatobacter sp.]
MEKTTKRAVDRVHQTREDGEESIKRTGEVIPIDSGKERASVQTRREGKPQPKKNKSRAARARKVQ